jgi:hypothetical protein
MSKQFFSRLSKNYIKILNDEYYDIIEAGEDLNVKIFHVHMIILCYHSLFLLFFFFFFFKSQYISKH